MKQVENSPSEREPLVGEDVATVRLGRWRGEDRAEILERRLADLEEGLAAQEDGDDAAGQRGR